MAEPSIPSDQNTQSSMPQINGVVTLLSPPPDLSTRLSNSAKTYNRVIANATDILTKTGVDLDAFRLADPNDKASGMRDMVVTIKTDFSRFADRETDLCKNLIAYGQLLAALVPKVDSNVLTMALGGRLEAFRKAMNEDAQDRAARAAKILGHVQTLLARLSDATTAIELLSRQASTMEDELRHQNVGSRLIEAMKKLFNLEDDKDDALTQISIILGIALSYLRGDFNNLAKNKKEMQAFIAKVNALQTGLEKTRASVLAMASNMTTSVEANAVLVGVWDFLSNNMTALKAQDKALISTEDQNKILINWELAKHAATEAIAAITGGTTDTVASLTISSSDSTGDAAPSITFPTSRAELQLFKLAGEVGVDHLLVEPEMFNNLTHLVAMPEIVQAQSAHDSSTAVQVSIMDAGDDERKRAAEELMKQLGPPALETVKTQLEALSGDCKQVVNTFSTILQTPFLQNLSILNPFKTVETPSEPENLNMREVVTRYKDKYMSLQNETKTTAKSLISYAAVQLALQPRVEMNPDKVPGLKPGDGRISVDTYYKACFNAISDYSAKATELRVKHSVFRDQWTRAQDNIVSKIEECKTVAARLKTEIQTKKDEYKNKTIVGVLEILGGVVCFTIGFLLPFLAPVAWPAGGVLLAMGIRDLIERGELDHAINNLTDQFNAADSAAKGLEKLKAPFATVESKLQSLIGIWNQIDQALANIKMNVSTLKGMPPGVIETLWAAFLQTNIKNWEELKRLITLYTEAIQ